MAEQNIHNFLSRMHEMNQNPNQLTSQTYYNTQGQLLAPMTAGDASLIESVNFIPIS